MMDHEQRTQARFETALRRVLRESASETDPHGAHRRRLMHEARRLAASHGLQALVDAAVYDAGCVAITGLAPPALARLVERLHRAADAVEAACDSPDAPPAR